MTDRHSPALSFTADLHAPASLRQVALKILKQMHAWWPANDHALTLLSDASPRFVTFTLNRKPRGSWSLSRKTTPPAISEWVLTAGKTTWIGEDHSRERRNRSDKPEALSLAVPLKNNHQIIGVVQVTHSQGQRPFRRHDVVRLEHWAEHAAVAIGCARRDEAQAHFVRELKLQVQAATQQLRMANQALRQIQQAKSENVSMVVHDIRTPATSISGFAKLLLKGRNGPLSARQREFCAIILKNAEYLERLLTDLLDLTKLELGRLPMQIEPLPCWELLQEAVLSLPDGSSDLRSRIHCELPARNLCILGDRLRLLQVLINLLSNALKYSPAGSPVRVHCQPAESVVRFYVEDKSPPINSEKRQVIFEKFTRLTTSPSAGPAGSGLGLAICKTIVECHGGKLWVEDAPGGGNVFCFELEMVPRAPTEPESLRLPPG